MIAFRYLSQGLNALARAHHRNTMAGHLGAAVISAYFVGEQHPDLDKRVSNGIEDDLARIMRGESVFGAKGKPQAGLRDAELFAPFAHEKPDPTLIDGIAEALAKNIAKPRQSGHNVIFASLAIRALKEHPEFATPSIADGIRKLIAKFNNTHPGTGYYGKDRGRISGNKIVLPAEEAGPAYTTLEGMAVAVLDEIINQSPKVHRQGYGGLVHVNNHAAAIVDLVNYGYPELVPPALEAHRLHLRLWSHLPNLVEELGPVPISATTPDRPAYWTGEKVPYDRALLTHRVKTMYGFDELAAVLDDDAKRTLAHRNLRFLL